MMARPTTAEQQKVERLEEELDAAREEENLAKTAMEAAQNAENEAAETLRETKERLKSELEWLDHETAEGRAARINFLTNHLLLAANKAVTNTVEARRHYSTAVEATRNAATAHQAAQLAVVEAERAAESQAAQRRAEAEREAAAELLVITPEKGLKLYQTLRATFSGPIGGEDRELAVTTQLSFLVSQPLREANLKNLLAHLDEINVRPTDNETVRMEAYLAVQAFSAEVRAKLDPNGNGNVLSNLFRRKVYDYRKLNHVELVDHAELAFTLIFQLNRLKPLNENSDVEPVESDLNLAERNAARGDDVARNMRSERLKKVGSFFLDALAAITLVVAVASVVALTLNPATAPVVFAIAATIAKVQIEVAAVAAFYAACEFINFVMNRYQQKKLETTTGKLLGAAAGAGLLMAAPAATAVAGVNPATVVVASAIAEAVGKAAVITATGAAQVTGALMIPAFLGVTAAAMLARARGMWNDSTATAQAARKALELTVENPGARTRRASVHNR